MCWCNQLFRKELKIFNSLFFAGYSYLSSAWFYYKGPEACKWWVWEPKWLRWHQQWLRLTKVNRHIWFQFETRVRSHVLFIMTAQKQWTSYRTQFSWGVRVWWWMFCWIDQLSYLYDWRVCHSKERGHVEGCWDCAYDWTCGCLHIFIVRFFCCDLRLGAGPLFTHCVWGRVAFSNNRPLMTSGETQRERSNIWAPNCCTEMRGGWDSRTCSTQTSSFPFIKAVMFFLTVAQNSDVRYSQTLDRGLLGAQY